ncbi:MAG TPA: polyribonucleotide nucleotidyltransferase, partial [Candidatus Dormibacteraeota bacterium]|nr:polyribonucleotide nucleotidyltransferase [Candidatus Dormibacteraeota bacterium]
MASQTPTVFETDYADRRLRVETGHVAEQAGGAVVVRAADTVVLVTAVASNAPREGIDFFPLTCDYEEKLYAAGRIPGSFPRREGRPSEAAILASRMIDRPMRPLFPKDFRNDVQVVATVLSSDQETDPTTLAVFGASLALAISGIPHAGPVGCARVGLVDGALVIHPTLQQLATSDLDLVVCGTYDTILMVEAGAHQIPEDTMLRAMRLAHDEIRRQVEFQRGIAAQIARPRMSYPPATVDPDVSAAVHEAVAGQIGTAARNPDKAAREAALDALRAGVRDRIAERFPERASDIGKAFESEL